MKKLFITCFILFNIGNIAFSQGGYYRGFYVEVLLKTNTGTIKNGGFLIDSSQIDTFFSTISYLTLLNDYKRLFDYNSLAFNIFKLPFPADINNNSQLDQNSIKLIVDYNFDKFYGSIFKLKSKSDYYFILKKIEIEYSSINKSAPTYSESRILDYSEQNNFLLNKIIQQKMLAISEVKKYCPSIKEISKRQLKKFDES